MPINGWGITAKWCRVLYPEHIKEYALARIDEFRPIVKATLGPEMIAKGRFNDNSYVYDVLESNVPLDEFKQYPMASVEKALRHSAETEWWYTHEKNYSIEEEHNAAEVIE